TNGNGLTNGNDVVRKYTRIPLIKSKRLKTRIIGAALAIALIFAPLTIYLVEFGAEPTGMIIDGNFSDWEDTKGYTDTVEDANTNPNINIINYKMVKENNDANFYLEVQGDMLKGTNPDVADTVHIFVDSDTNTDTGYSVAGIGADYMLEAQGKSGCILSSDVKIFDPTYRTVDDDTRDQNDWNGWCELQNGELKCAGNKLEAKISLFSPSEVGVEVQDQIFACFRLADAKGNEDYSDNIVGNGQGALIVKQKSVASEILTADLAEVLELEFTAVANDVTIDSITITHEGGGTLISIPTPLTILRDATEIFTVVLNTTTAQYGDFATVKISNCDDIVVRDNVPVTLVGSGSTSYIKAAPTEIKIDGVFADWNNIASHSDELFEDSVNGNQNIDIVEHCSVNQNDKLSFYLKVDGTMMKGSKILTKPLVWTKPEKATTPETPKSDVSGTELELNLPPLPKLVGKDAAYVFIDADKNPESGYITQDMAIGADYIIQLTGQDGKILSRSLYEYNPTVAYTNSGWSRLPVESTEVMAATDSTQLETQISIKNILNFEDEVDVFFMMTDWNGNRDSSDKPIIIPALSPSTGNHKYVSYGTRSNYDTVNYTNGIVDLVQVWNGIGGGSDGYIMDFQDQVGGTYDIRYCKVCDNGSWVNFYVQMYNIALPFDQNVCVYIDNNSNGSETFALFFDLTSGTGPGNPEARLYFNSSGIWMYMGDLDNETQTGYIEMGVNLSYLSPMLNPGDTFNFFVTTETKTVNTDDSPDFLLNGLDRAFDAALGNRS
ncbi:MAG: hypothetical protein KAJ51_00165, partial [Thermoplasmata archaeon]|nr:hypothetical protein [Thermoplasmata archaeon]